MGGLRPTHLPTHDQSNRKGNILLLICVFRGVFQFYPYRDNLQSASKILHFGGVWGEGVHEFDVGVGGVKIENRVQGQ